MAKLLMKHLAKVRRLKRERKKDITKIKTILKDYNLD